MRYAALFAIFLMFLVVAGCDQGQDEETGISEEPATSEIPSPNATSEMAPSVSPPDGEVEAEADQDEETVSGEIQHSPGSSNQSSMESSAPEAESVAQALEPSSSEVKETEAAPTPEPEPVEQPVKADEPKAAEDEPTPPATMVLSAPSEVSATQSPVNFSHEIHAALECVDCHHTWSGSGPVAGCTSQGCHDLFMPETTEDKRSSAYYFNAFHSRTSQVSCVGCHGANKKAGKPSGPVACNECHPKE
ncbi:MAG: cytochrome c3 family protein [Desulfohalobiaceae bacterium]